MVVRLTDADLEEIIYERNLPSDLKCQDGIAENISLIDCRFGKATMRETWFEGVHISHGSISLQNDISLKLESDTPIIEMHFNLAGTQYAQVYGNGQKFVVRERQHNMFYMPEFEGYIESARQKETSQMLEIHLTEAYFQRFVSTDSTLLNRFTEKIDKKELSMLHHLHMTITPYMETLVQQILQCSKQGIMKRLFLESKVMELLMLQIEQFETSVEKKQSTVIKANDAEKIHHARHLLEQNISKPYSLLELSRMVGLNDFKLKKGFKEVFGNTVFGYLHEIRMQEAKKLLLDQQKSIHEVAEYCGYQYVQHFSTAFKKRFGITPGGMRV
ncbi:helix-turn-helix transcriptional regulator [Ohtaekwangia kribbensis]|jgi:AraC-like DNA-binding protein|uniref:Helix-turn-helix transcriptional regulator n=1 Tax=Ohtaekwangia kribbensis TaxID=688913 RepID=A0ABW3JYG9_9BACT